MRIETWIRQLNGADPYELLGVDRAADRTAIVRAHRQRIRRVHPDLPTGDTERARLVHLARDILLDPQRRRAYDLLGGGAAAVPDPPSRGRPEARTAASRGGSARAGAFRAGARSAWDGPDVPRGGRRSPRQGNPPRVPPRRRPPPPPPRPARDPPRRPKLRSRGDPQTSTSRAADIGTVVIVALVLVLTWTCCAVVTLML